MAYKKRIFVTVLMLLIISCQLFAATNTKINMNFKGADIRDVLRTIAELAGVNLVTDGSVSGEITVHLKDLLFNDALKLITQTNDLEYKWYENTVVVATPEKMDEIYANIIVKTVEVKYASLTEVREVIIGVYPQIEIIPDPRNNKLIFKGRVEDIRVAEDLLAKLDTEKEVSFDIVMVPADKAEFLKNYIQKVYPEMVVESDEQGNFVMYGTAYDIESASLLLNNLVKQLSGGAYLGGTYALLENIKIDYLDVNYVKDLVGEMYPNMNIIADSKNSQLIFNGSEEQLRQIKDLVSIIDVEYLITDENLVSKMVEVNHTLVNDVISEINNISNSLNVEILENNKQVLITGSQRDVDRAVARIKAMDIDAETLTKIVSINYATLEDLENIVKELYPDISFLTNHQKREVVLSGKRLIVNEAIELINGIDIPRKQVIIKVRIEEIIASDIETLGVKPISEIQFISPTDFKLEGIGLTAPEIFDVLESISNTNTLASPSLMTLSGEEASLLIGQEIPVQVSVIQDGNAISTIEYIKAGINLEITPWITTDDYINLFVRSDVSSIGDSVGASLPAINTRRAETNVRLYTGETLAIGGLIQDDLIESIEKIPLLGDIPILGDLFKHTQTSNRKNELVIFITPVVVDDGMEYERKELTNEVVVSEIEETKVESNELTENREDEKKTVVDNKEVSIEAVEKPVEKPVVNKSESDREKVTIEEKDIEFVVDNKTAEKKKSDELVFLSTEQVNALLGIDEKREATRIKEEKDHSTSTSYESKPLDNDIPDESIGEVEKEEPEDKFTPEIIIEEPEPVDLSTYYLYKYPLKSETAIKDIASLFSVDEELIKAANKDNDLVVGGFAVIPLEESRIHVMEKGETLWKIHNLYGVSVEDIKLLNNISDDSNIPVGVVIVIPEK